MNLKTELYPPFHVPASGVLELEKTKALYRDLLSVYDKLILPTHASYHVQYCVFYLCSFRLVSTRAPSDCEERFDLLVRSQVKHTI